MNIRISDFCFIFAGASALAGMTLGMIMGITQDFTLAPSHAHLNLLGWVTSAIYGLYHRGVGRTGGVVGWLQVASGAVGAAGMALGLALYLSSGDHAFMPLVIGGSLLALLGMVLFVGLVLSDVIGNRAQTLPGMPMSA